MGIIESIKQQVEDNNTRLIDIESKLNKYLEAQNKAYEQLDQLFLKKRKDRSEEEKSIKASLKEDKMDSAMRRST